MNVLRTRRAFIYLALSIMTASWIAWLLWALLGDAGPSLPVTLVVVTPLILVPLGLGRWLRKLELRQNLHRGLLAGAFVFLALLILSSGFYNDYGLFGGSWLDRLAQDDLSSGTFTNQGTSLMLVGLCWWLGLTLGDMPLTSVYLTRYFYACLAILAVSSITSTLFAHDTFREAPWLYFVLLFAAMVTLGLGRVEEAARRSQNRGSLFTSYWLSHLGVTAGIVLSLVGVAQALKLAFGFGLILVIISPVITVLIYPLVFVGAKGVAFVFAVLLERQTQTAEAPDLSAAGPETAGTISAYNPSTAQHFCVGLVIVVFLVVVLLAIAYGTRRWRKILKDQEEEELAALPSLGDRIADVVQERLERLRFRLPGTGGLRRRLATRSIRRIYAALVTLGAERGYPRPAARTPYQHLRALRQAFPGSSTQIERITEAYVATHYGEVPETHEALDEIKAAWEHVREQAHHTPPVGTQVAGKSSHA